MSIPTNLPEWDKNEVNIVEVDTQHKEEGWLAPAGVPEKPPFQSFNWWQNLVYKWILRFKNVTGGLDNMTDLLSFDEKVDGTSVNVRGYIAINDGGGGVFNYDSSIDKSTANGGTIIDPDETLATQGDGVGNGCWIRQYSGAVNVLWFGAYNDNTNPSDTVIAIERAIATLARVIFFPFGDYSVNSTIQVGQGQKIQGESGLRFSTNKSKILMTLADTLVFDQSLSTSSGQEDAMSCNDVYIESDRCIRLNDETILVDSAGTNPFLMRGEFRRNTFISKTQGLGYGILASKMFDSVIEQNEFRGHARELVLQGCDLNKVVTNRIWLFDEYGILELGVGTFGSQNLIEHNDILAPNALGVFIKTTNRQIRIKDNYLEKATGGSGCKGFIDASTTDAPTYGANPVSTSTGYSVVIVENRLDGQDEATDFVYRIDPTYFVNCTIEDVKTTGVSAAEWLTVVGDYLPVRFNPGHICNYSLSGGSDSIKDFYKFKNKQIEFGGDRIKIDAESLTMLDRGSFGVDNGADHLALSQHGIIVYPSLGETIAQLVLPTSEGVVNPWMKDTESWEVSIMARTLTATDTVDILIMIDGAGSGNVSTALTTQNTNIVIPFTAGSAIEAMGIGIRRLNTPIENVLIQSIEFRKV